MSEPIQTTSNQKTRRFRPLIDGGHIHSIAEVGNPNGQGGWQAEYVLAVDHDAEIERLRAEVTEAENEARDANVRADRIAADWTRKRVALTIISTKWSRHVAECQCTLCRIIDVATEALSGDYHE